MGKVKVILTVKYPRGYSCGAFGTVTGTPTEVVEVMFENRSPFLDAKSLRAYMIKMVKDSNAMGIRGTPRSKNLERYCLTFLKIMAKSDVIKILPSHR